MIKTLQKIAVAAFGFLVGVITAPIFAALWPFAAAYILLQECFCDEEGDSDSDGLLDG